MKGLSIVVVLGLLVLVQYLARHFHASGALPLENRPDSVEMGSGKASTSPALTFQL